MNMIPESDESFTWISFLHKITKLKLEEKVLSGRTGDSEVGSLFIFMR
jgi:hypothetical protein